MLFPFSQQYCIEKSTYCKPFLLSVIMLLGDVMKYFYTKLFLAIFLLLAYLIFLLIKINNNIVVTIITWLLFFYFLYDIGIALIPYKNKPSYSNKAFSQYYIPSNSVDTDNLKKQNKAALLIFITYSFLIISIGYLHYYFTFFNDWFIYLWFLLFNIADYVCVIFWCPFQHLFIKNKCCNSCRISNWDRLMKYVVLFFSSNILANILAVFSTVVFIQWEYLHYKHPERFYISTNKKISCQNCSVKICKNKTIKKRFI